MRQLEEEGLSIGRDKSNEHFSPYGLTMLEIMPAPHSSVVGQTLKDLDFRRRFGFTAVALRRPDQSFRTNVGDIKLALGDSLLLIGRREVIERPAKRAGLHRPAAQPERPAGGSTARRDLGSRDPGGDPRFGGWRACVSCNADWSSGHLADRRADDGRSLLLDRMAGYLS